MAATNDHFPNFHGHRPAHGIDVDAAAIKARPEQPQATVHESQALTLIGDCSAAISDRSIPTPVMWAADFSQRLLSWLPYGDCERADGGWLESLVLGNWLQPSNLSHRRLAAAPSLLPQREPPISSTTFGCGCLMVTASVLMELDRRAWFPVSDCRFNPSILAIFFFLLSQSPESMYA